MPDHMQLIVTIRKTVANAAEAAALLEQLKTLLEDQEGITINAHTSNHYDLTEESSQ